ncbi:hypothetical protein BDZ97DRAFT_1648381 [Flammula alnicola]|nr:hypothetical protein BDZ97DRAFT_1648381 [Flammula alnicola]
MRSSSHSQSSTISSPHPLTRKPETPIPKPLGEEESPEVYLTRLKSAVSKAEVAGILASSSDPFYSQALRAYINQFEFHDIPLDVALRKLLMEVGLPRETQQIDRVMEAFASRYMYCNANIFTSEDHPYILAFSLIMLHTDTFNPSNKRKMTKADYIKNTKLPGLPTEILDCFFDNIVFAPFIFIEDPVDFNGQPGLTADVARSLTINTPTSALSSSNGPATFKIGNKLDPYYLIINNLLEPLRVDVKSHVPLENPFTYEGTEGPWDEQELHGAFVNANIIDIDVPSVHRTGTVFSLNPSGIPLITDDTELPGMSRPKVATWSLKITKVGVLNRKDDILEGGKKSSNRKWRTWSVILTGSQLLLFRDPTWAAALSLSPDTPMVQQATSQPAAVFRPDESFSVKDAVAVYDRSYTKYKHTMRFVLPDGRQLLFQAADDMHLNEWISRINYASAFKSAGVRMRPPGLSGEDVHLTGVAAATSHLHDMQQRSQLRRHRSWDSNAAHDLMDMLSGQNRQPLKRRVTMSGRADFDLDVPTAPEIEGAEQFKATFDQVKADLATGSWSSLDNDPWLLQTEDRDNNIYESPPTSPGSSGSSASRFPSRSQIVQSKIRDLDSKILASQSQHDSDVRHIRNIAILTPFQKSTRSRLSAAIQNLAKRVALVRLDIEKLKCHRHVLRCDVASEGRSWNHSKQVALRAAKETLQSRCAHTIPTMTLSLHNDLATSSTADSSHLPNTPSSQRPESSASDSFHSAADFGIEWTSSEDLTFFTTYSELPKKSPSSPAPHAPPLDDCQDSRRSLSSSSNSNHRGSTQTEDIGGADSHEKGCDDEQAEEWNRTRCAQRVSLIHVPSHIRISTKMRGSADP